MKKSIVSLTLIIVLILSTLSFTSCGNGKKIETVDGKKPKEAISIALQKLEDIENYKLEIDMEIESKLLFIPLVDLEFENFSEYTYNGDNELYTLSQEAKQKLKDEGMEEAIANADDMICYVDGVCYVKHGATKYKFESATSPVEKCEYEKAVKEIIEENSSEIQAYIDEGEYYFIVEITDKNEMKLDKENENETYTIYLDDEGRITKIIAECKLMSISNYTFVAEYSYDDVPGITAPKDAAEYTAS